MKLKLLFILFLFTQIGAGAQSYFTIRTGYATSKVAVSEQTPGDFTFKSGYHAGIGFEINAVKNVLSVLPELLYVQKGFTTTLNHPDWQTCKVVYKDEVKINYLEIPVLLRLNLNQHKVRLFANAGPSFSVGLGGTALQTAKGACVVSNTTFITDESTTGEVKFTERPFRPDNNIYINKRFDWGLQMGAGLSYALPKSKITAEARYGRGLSSINGDDNYKTRTILVSLAYAFMLPQDL
jgi:opacity protein-like surface antigen